MDKIVGIGTGGHARVLIDIIRQRNAFDVVGLLDPRPERADREVDGVRILGGDELLSELAASGVQFVFLGVGGVGDNRPRAALWERVLALGFRFPSLVHPRAVVASSATLGNGTIVAANAVVGVGSACGVNTIVNTGAIVDHGCTVGDHVHLSTGSVLAADVKVGSLAHVGIGAMIRQGVSIGEGALVGMGAVVVRDVPAGQVVVGNPARSK